MNDEQFDIIGQFLPCFLYACTSSTNHRVRVDVLPCRSGTSILAQNILAKAQLGFQSIDFRGHSSQSWRFQLLVNNLLALSQSTSMMSLVYCSSCCSFLAFSSSAFFNAACTFALRAVTISSRRIANDALTLFTSRLADLRIASWVLASLMPGTSLVVGKHDVRFG